MLRLRDKFCGLVEQHMWGAWNIQHVRHRFQGPLTMSQLLQQMDGLMTPGHTPAADTGRRSLLEDGSVHKYMSVEVVKRCVCI